MALSATELRIGNWLHYSRLDIIKSELRDSYFQVIADDILYLTEEHDVIFIEPIPLTEEWLLKFGFKKANKKKDIYPESLIMDNVMMSRLYFRPSYRGGYYWGFLTQGRMETKETDHEFYDIEPMLYVHQLQNLYFALTENELILMRNDQP